MIRAVIFDLDNTLVDDYESSRLAIARACETAAELSPGLSAAELGEAYWTVSLEVWNGVEARIRAGESMAAINGAEFRRECWSKALAACGVTEAAVAEAVVESYAHWRDELLPLFPETEETLEALRSSVKLAIVTNGTADTHRRKLRRLGFEELFDCCVVAGEFGPGKPDPAIFLHAAALLGVRPEECLVVGDNVEADVAGAKAAGMGAVWFNREGLPRPTEGVQPDHEIKGLREVVGLVRGEA